MRWIRLTVLVVAGSLTACASAPAPEGPAAREGAAPPRVILFIGDGVGTAYWTAARFTAGTLAAERLPVVGLVDTRSASARITDSAAAATTYATGVRTFNGAIGVGPDSMPLQTVLEFAEERGLATGLVATSSITHATPASFAAHVPSRSMQAEIAAQMAEHEVDVVLGGGLGFFDGRLRPDSQDLVPGLRARYTVVDDPAVFGALALDTVAALLGLFAENHMPPAAERAPTLPEMTNAALEILARDPDGFFVMVEASQPDWRGHANDPLELLVAEMLDFDRAIDAALAFQERYPETLIVVTADHETGGLTLHEDSTGALVAAYTTGYHTPAMVPLFAGGPGAERFAGVLPNTRVGQLLLQRIRGSATADAAAADGSPRAPGRWRR